MTHLKINVYDSQGNPLPASELSSIRALDLDREPLTGTKAKFISDGETEILYPGTPFSIALPLSVRGFGKVYLHADADGKGYSSRIHWLQLNQEFAQSRLHAVARQEKRYGKFKVDTTGVRERLTQAQFLLEQAGQAESASEQAALIEQSLHHSLWAGEELVLQVARFRVERIGWRDAFLWGCEPNQNRLQQAEKEHFVRLFNFLPLNFNQWTIPDDYESPDNILRWAQQAHVTLKGRLLLSTDFDEDIETTQKQLTNRMLEHTSQILSHYRGRIRYWDILTDPHLWLPAAGYNKESMVTLTRRLSDAAKEIDPQYVRIISVKYDLMEPSSFSYLRACVEADVPFECVDLRVEWAGIDLWEMDHLLEHYADLGKPLHLTLSLPPTRQEPGQKFEWHEAPSENMQADWLEAVYTLAYSKPYIVAICCSPLSDSSNEQGILRRDYTPKPAYERLHALRKQLHTPIPPSR
jgi:endo-1,4-beta-xylanase